MLIQEMIDPPSIPCVTVLSSRRVSRYWYFHQPFFARPTPATDPSFHHTTPYNLYNPKTSGDRKRMARLYPFRALRYDPARVHMEAVVTQPYDKITPAMQQRYYESSPYNLVRVILGKQEPGDTDPQEFLPS